MAVHELLAEGASTSELGEGFSKDTSIETRVVDGREIDWYVAPADSFVVLADNEALGGGGFIAHARRRRYRARQRGVQP